MSSRKYSASLGICGAVGGSCPLGALSILASCARTQQLVGGAVVGSLALMMAVASTRM